MDNISSHKSAYSQLKDLVKVLSSIRGDLSNVTGPPNFLAPASVVEVGHCWAERPAIFAAPGLEPDPARRCLLVLRFFLAALRSQLYVGGCPAGGPTPSRRSSPASSSASSSSASSASSLNESDSSGSHEAVSLKKPLNAFLGELHFASWKEDGEDATAAAAGMMSPSPSSFSTSSTSTISATTTSATTTATTSSSSSRPPSLLTSNPPPRTRLVAEQVSHHPPITAMHIASDPAHGVRADGYARVEMTFNGSVNVRQVGHGVLRLARFADEAYVFPLPDVKVRGFLAGCMYPEITGTYRILSSSGYAAEMVFSGEGLLPGWGARNAFKARVYRRGGWGGGGGGGGTTGKKKRGDDDEEDEDLYEVSGCWSQAWTVRDARSGEVIEEFDHADPRWAAAPRDPDRDCGGSGSGDDGDGIDDMDPWESRRAWAGVLDALVAGDMSRVVAEKARIEQAQRDMRARERAEGRRWEPLLFRAVEGSEHDLFHRVVAGTGGGGGKGGGERRGKGKGGGKEWALDDDRTKGVWMVDEEKLKGARRPFRGELTPLG